MSKTIWITSMEYIITVLYWEYIVKKQKKYIWFHEPLH